jgi:hypothetical protein
MRILISFFKLRDRSVFLVLFVTMATKRRRPDSQETKVTKNCSVESLQHK